MLHTALYSADTTQPTSSISLASHQALPCQLPNTPTPILPIPLPSQPPSAPSLLQLATLDPSPDVSPGLVSHSDVSPSPISQSDVSPTESIPLIHDTTQ